MRSTTGKESEGRAVRRAPSMRAGWKKPGAQAAQPRETERCSTSERLIAVEWPARAVFVAWR